MMEIKLGTPSVSSKIKPKGLGNRHILALMGFIGFSISYSLRFNLSMAIVAMVNSTSKPSQNLDQILFQADVCPHLLQVHLQQLRTGNNNNDTNLYSYLNIEESALPESVTFYSLEDQDQFAQTGTETIKPITTPEVIVPLAHDEVKLLPVPLKSLNPPPPSPSSIISSTVKAEFEDEPPGEFNWSESEQGLIHGSFFWGYILTQIPGGWMGHRFGGKWPFGIGLLITGILAILTPFAARYGGLEWIIVVRFVQGFGGGVTVPAMYGLLAKWLPPDERGQLTAFVYAGMAFGSALSMVISGYIIHYLGWPSVFYVSGGVTVLWFALWTQLIYSSPDEHPRISQEELKYIQNSIQGNCEFQVQSCSPKKPPWRKILKSLPFWAVIFGQTSETWGLYTIMTELPTYMKTVLHFDIKEGMSLWAWNSLMSAFPHLLTWAVSILITQVGDYFIEKRYFSIGTVRKACNTLGLWGSAAALMGVAYSGCDRTITVTLLGIAVASMGGIYGGVLVNMIDIAPNYASVLMGISNSCASIPGFLAPWVAGLLIDNNPSLERWRLVFLITAGVSFIGNLLFLLFASGEEQSWNWDDEENKMRKKSRDTVDVSSFNEAQFYGEGSGSSVGATTMPMTMIVSCTTYDDHHVG